MKLLLVSQSYAPHYEKGGQPVKVEALARALVSQGHEVSVLTAGYGNPGARAIEDRDGVVVRSASHLGRYRSVTIPLGVSALLGDADYDAAHLFGFYDLLLPIAARRLRHLRIPYVFEPIGTYRPIVRSLAKKRFYRATLGRGIVDNASRVIATSEQERDELVAEGVGATRIEVRRNGVDLSMFARRPSRGRMREQLGVPPDAWLFLSFGRISRKKGLVTLLRAFAPLASRAHLAIVGPDDRDGELAELESLIRERALWDRVHLVPPRYGTEKLEAFTDADTFVLSSINENFGNSAAEAAAAGLPVIVTRSCGIAPLLADRCALVVDGDETSLRASMTRLLDEPELAKRLAATAPRVAAELSWDEPVKQMETIYAAISGRAR